MGSPRPSNKDQRSRKVAIGLNSPEGRKLQGRRLKVTKSKVESRKVEGRSQTSRSRSLLRSKYSK